jgi:hypothetical protein
MDGSVEKWGAGLDGGRDIGKLSTETLNHRKDEIFNLLRLHLCLGEELGGT